MCRRLIGRDSSSLLGILVRLDPLSWLFRARGVRFQDRFLDFPAPSLPLIHSIPWSRPSHSQYFGGSKSHAHIESARSVISFLRQYISLKCNDYRHICSSDVKAAG